MSKQGNSFFQATARVLRYVSVSGYWLVSPRQPYQGIRALGAARSANWVKWEVHYKYAGRLPMGEPRTQGIGYLLHLPTRAHTTTVGGTPIDPRSVVHVVSAVQA